MRRATFLGILFGLIFGTPTTEAFARSGEEMLQSCMALLNAARTDPRTGAIFVADEGLACWWYFEAFQDLSLSWNRNTGVSVLGFCPPSEIQVMQYVRVYVNAAQAYPALLHERASGLAVAAFRQAFPCSVASPPPK